MEKYLVIIIVLVLAYYLHNCWVESKIEKFINSNKIREGFGDAVTVDAVDDNNAINVLAKIAKDIQEGGGLKVKGVLNVDGISNLNNGINVAGAGSGISNPGPNLKMNSQGLIFGGPNNGLQGDSAQISAGLHDANSLCMVGMGKTAGERKITMWSEGGMKIHGSMIQDVSHVSGVGSYYKTKNGSSYRIIGGCGPGCGSDNSLDIHRYKPDGGWEGLPLSIVGNDTNVNGTLRVRGRDILAEIDELKSRTIKTGSKVQIVGKAGRLDNYYSRCNKGDGDRDVGIQCGGGNGALGNIEWIVNAV